MDLNPTQSLAVSPLASSLYPLASNLCKDFELSNLLFC